MTIHFRQHIPNFVSGVEPAEGDVANLDALLALEFIERWSSGPDFSRFSRSMYYSPDKWLLMAEMKDGSYWVVAYISPRDALDSLPEWVHPSREQA